MMFIGTAGADVSTAKFEPFVGIDYQQTWMTPSTKNDQQFLPKSFPGANVYVGTKFMKSFGAEFGVDQSANKKKNWIDEKLGKGATKLRRTSVHLDLLGFLPVNECFEVFANVGIGFTKIRAKAKINYLNFTVIGDEAKTRNKPTLRLGLGALYMVTDTMGVRAKLGWENTGKLKDKKDKDKNFKNSNMLFLGAFVKF